MWGTIRDCLEVAAVAIFLIVIVPFVFLAVAQFYGW